MSPGEQSKNNRLAVNCQGVHKDTTLRKPKLSQEMFFFLFVLEAVVSLHFLKLTLYIVFIYSVRCFGSFMS